MRSRQAFAPRKNWPPRWRTRLVYRVIRWGEHFLKWLEARHWGYQWCVTCHGRSIVPRSGIWVQPDGWRLCPRCKGHRWEHVGEAREKMRE